MPNNNEKFFDAKEALRRLREEQAKNDIDMTIDLTVDNKYLKEENEKAINTIEKQEKTIKELVDKNTKLESENERLKKENEKSTNIIAAQSKIIEELIERFWVVTDEEKKTNKEIDELLKELKKKNEETQKSLSKMNKTEEEGKQGLGHIEKESSGGKIPIEAFEIINKSLDNLKLEELQDKINRTNNERNKTQRHAVKEGGKTSTENNNLPTMN